MQVSRHLIPLMVLLFGQRWPQRPLLLNHLVVRRFVTEHHNIFSTPMSMPTQGMDICNVNKYYFCPTFDDELIHKYIPYLNLFLVLHFLSVLQLHSTPLMIPLSPVSGWCQVQWLEHQWQRKIVNTYWQLTMSTDRKDTLASLNLANPVLQHWHMNIQSLTMNHLVRSVTIGLPYKAIKFRIAPQSGGIWLAHYTRWIRSHTGSIES